MPPARARCSSPPHSACKERCAARGGFPLWEPSWQAASAGCSGDMSAGLVSRRPSVPKTRSVGMGSTDSETGATCDYPRSGVVGAPRDDASLPAFGVMWGGATCRNQTPPPGRELVRVATARQRRAMDRRRTIKPGGQKEAPAVARGRRAPSRRPVTSSRAGIVPDKFSFAPFDDVMCDIPGTYASADFDKGFEYA
jgi:hypothetical protein